MRITGRHLALATLAISIASAGVHAQQPQAVWAGWARCQVDVQGPGYTDRQIHTWVLTGGAPTVEGAFRVYEGTWSVVGGGSLQRTQGTQTLVAQWATNVQGIRAPIAVFVRASDGRMLISARHAQLRASGAIAGYQQQTIDGKPQSPGQIASEAFEWAFPVVDGEAKGTTISGSSAPAVSGSVGYMQPGGSRGTASCTWLFGQGSVAPRLPPAVTAQAVPVPGGPPSAPPAPELTVAMLPPAIPTETLSPPATAAPTQTATTTPVQMTTTTAVQSPNEAAAPTASLVPAAIQTTTLSGGGTQPAPSTQTGGSSLGNGTLTLAREWTGSATCQIDITTGENYIDQQIHTWTIKRGSTVTADGSYDATWTLSGHGFNAVASTVGAPPFVFPTVNRDLWTYKADAWAPLAVVAASGGRLKIVAQHPQRVARGGATGVETYTYRDGNPWCYNHNSICETVAEQHPHPDTSIDFVVAEFPFPAIEVPPIVESANTGAHTSGTVSIPVNGPLTPWQPSNASGTASCSWDFHQEVAGH